MGVHKQELCWTDRFAVTDESSQGRYSLKHKGPEELEDHRMTTTVFKSHRMTNTVFTNNHIKRNEEMLLITCTPHGR